jgi:hypothetical protein
MSDTGIEWPWGSPTGPKKPVLANDLFRAVHDAFGHGLEGAGFRARGEENAWQAHARLFTGPALGALTSETRGQNSWVNYGPYSEKNQTAKVEDIIFADQKTGLMPEWTWTEGVQLAADRFYDDGPAFQDGNLVYDRVVDRFRENFADDASVEEVMSAIDDLRPEERNFYRALGREGWLGFDYPSQAIDAILEEPDNFDLSPQVKTALGRYVNIVAGESPAQYAAARDMPVVYRGVQTSEVTEERLGTRNPALVGKGGVNDFGFFFTEDREFADIYRTQGRTKAALERDPGRVDEVKLSGNLFRADGAKTGM